MITKTQILKKFLDNIPTIVGSGTRVLIAQEFSTSIDSLLQDILESLPEPAEYDRDDDFEDRAESKGYNFCLRQVKELIKSKL